MRLVKNLLLCCLLLIGEMAQAVGFLEKLDQTTELNKLTPIQLAEGRYQLTQMLTQCEFDESCLLKMIDDLKVLENKTHNPMYQVYATYLQSMKSELTNQIKRCDIPDKKVVRKAVAECLQEMNIKEGHLKVDRKMIDQLEDERDVCIKNKMETIANAGNLFAQATLVNFYEQSRDQKKMDYWYNQMQKKMNTPEYSQYLACPDIP
ncbi:hypothetical protein [Candidatus Berkiella aquae]|uniref:Lysozyme inhibitor LprI N-terminal domain-containing protein n=1 Tax=Candidatus Berkiella aquae TaxID=295108 RepID=A0A0Q9YLT2_9GAMM|nr:hypothetical protein [Candidatus Berkiella aquae]MCS5710568.1 hypothetical protein [Candidatus Berkiella aquae]